MVGVAPPPEEEWARRCMQEALKCEVFHYDDGSRPAMYDLRISLPRGATGAAEVTMAMDADAHVQWNLLNGSGRWTEPDLDGGWSAIISPNAEAKAIRRDLPALLREAEAVGLTRIAPVRFLAADPMTEKFSELSARATRMKIRDIHQYDTDFPGSIYCTVLQSPDRIGGWGDDDSNRVASWIGPFLSEERPRHVDKLAGSGGDERHAFVILPTFACVAFEVVSPLMKRKPCLPTIDPHLPGDITHAWVVSLWGDGPGFYWSPQEGWQYFVKSRWPA